jgi:hypothetical protein
MVRLRVKIKHDSQELDISAIPKEPEAGYKKDFFGQIRRPGNDASDHTGKIKETGEPYKNPLLINEYGWIWLIRLQTMYMTSFGKEANEPRRNAFIYMPVIWPC